MAASKKNAARLGASLVFANGVIRFHDDPRRYRRTWAPIGQTPLHRHYYRRDRISVIGG